MTYDYKCNKCGEEWEDNLPMTDRDKPTNEKCPHCGEKGLVERVLSPTFLSTNPPIKVRKKAGDGWNDVLKKIKAGSGKNNTIETF